MPMPTCARCRGRAARCCPRSKRHFPARPAPAASTAQSSARWCSAIREALARLEAIVHPAVARSARSIPAPNMPARRWWCSTFRCCSKRAAREQVDAVRGGFGARRSPARAGAGAAGHDARRNSRRSSRCSCPTPKSAPAPISSSIPAASLAETRAAAVAQLVAQRLLAADNRCRPLPAARSRPIDNAMREIVFDTETTGLDPRTRRPDGRNRLHRDGQPGADRPHLSRLFQSRARHAGRGRGGPRPVRRVPGRQAAVSPTRARICSTFSAIRRWSRTMRGSISASSTPNWRCCGLDPVVRRRGWSTPSRSPAARHPGAKLSLDALCTRYGIDRSHRVKHGALLDAELLAQVYVELTGGRQIGLELAADAHGDRLVEVSRVVVRRAREFRRASPHAASAEELARHAAFLETMESPLWAVDRSRHRVRSIADRRMTAMEIRVSGHQIDTGEALQDHAADRLNGDRRQVFQPRAFVAMSLSARRRRAPSAAIS